MDTSNQYLRMRELAEPYIPSVLGSDGYEVVDEGNFHIVVVDMFGNYGVRKKNKLEDFTGDLPRQDQLQAMIHDPEKESQVGVIHLINDLYDFAKKAMCVGITFSSLEQWWLAYVMYYKFNKHWNGKQWVPSRCPIHNIPITSDGMCPHCQAEHDQEQEVLALQADAEAAAQAEAEAREAEERGHAEEMEHQYDGSGDQ